MSNRHNPHYIVFGAGGKHNKAVIAGRSPKLAGYEVNIVGLTDGDKYKAGESIDPADINAIYTTLYFTKLDSLRAFAKAINETVEKWVGEYK